VGTTGGELETGADDEVSDDPGDEHLPRDGEGTDARADVRQIRRRSDAADEVVAARMLGGRVLNRFALRRRVDAIDLGDVVPARSTVDLVGVSVAR
jgi:hypothetical protein